MSAIELPHRCPHCGKDNEMVTSVMDEAPPEPGDISLCWTCMGPAVFNLELRLRLPTPAELEEIRADPVVQRLRELRHEVS